MKLCYLNRKPPVEIEKDKDVKLTKSEAKELDNGKDNPK